MALTSQITTSLLQVDGRMTEGGVIEIVPGARLLLDVGVEDVEPGALLDDISAALDTAAASAESAAASAQAAAAIADIDSTDSAVAALVSTPAGPETQAALSATIESGKDNPGGSTLAALPRLVDAFATFNDASPTTMRVIGLGSSVSLGPDGSLDATNAASAYLRTKLNDSLNRAGKATVTHTNGGVSGSVIFQALASDTDYADAKTAAGGAPKLVVLAYGMNDGMPDSFHRGQTFPAVYEQTLAIIRQVRADGGDVVILTSPHPHTTRTPWGISGAATYSHSGGTPVPAANAAGSVVTIPAPTSGNPVPASYRHLRVNEAMRQAAREAGAVLVDAERFWLDAVDKYGEDALYNTGQYNHPNLFSYQQSYHRAIDAFAASLTRPAIQASPETSRDRDMFTRRVDNTTRDNTTLSNDNQLTGVLAANSVYEVHITAYYTGDAGDLRISLSLPAGASGRASVQSPGQTASNHNGDAMISRSVPLPDTYGLTCGGNGADAVATYRALVVTGSTAGPIAAQFCQDTDTGVTTIYANTHMRVRKVA